MVPGGTHTGSPSPLPACLLCSDACLSRVDRLPPTGEKEESETRVSQSGKDGCLATKQD